MKRLNAEEVDSIVGVLMGTCMHLLDGANIVLGEEVMPDDESVMMINESIFECEECGFWQDIGELFDNNICEECNEDE